MRNYYLYQITNQVNGKRYIGYTGWLTARKAAHFNPDGKRGSKLVHAAIKKYGRAAFDFKVMMVCGDEDYAKQTEIKAIAAYNTVAPNGYNISIGGEGMSGVRFTPERKEAARLRMLGKPKAPEAIRKLSEARTGMKLTPEHCRNISLAKKGQGHASTPETNAKISAANKGRKPWTTGVGHSDATKAKCCALLSPLDEGDVREIRVLVDFAPTIRAIAKYFKIDPKTVRRIRDRKGWRHLT